MILVASRGGCSFGSKAKNLIQLSNNHEVDVKGIILTDYLTTDPDEVRFEDGFVVNLGQEGTDLTHVPVLSVSSSVGSFLVEALATTDERAFELSISFSG